MTATEAALLIGATGTLVTALTSTAALLVTIRSKKDISRLEVNTNSIKDALVKTTADASKAEGIDIGIARQKANPT